MCVYLVCVCVRERTVDLCLSVMDLCVCVSERTMDLLVTLVNNINSGLLWLAVSGRQLGRLEPCAHLVLQLSMVAVRTGLLVVTQHHTLLPRALQLRMFKPNLANLLYVHV